MISSNSYWSIIVHIYSNKYFSFSQTPTTIKNLLLNFDLNNCIWMSPCKSKKKKIAYPSTSTSFIWILLFVCTIDCSYYPHVSIIGTQANRNNNFKGTLYLCSVSFSSICCILCTLFHSLHVSHSIFVAFFYLQ